MALKDAGFQPGDVLAFSAGSSDSQALKWRRADRAVSARQQVGGYGGVIPGLRRVLAGRLPAVVSAYPAPMGPFADAVFVDSYIRAEVVSAALELFARHGCPTVLLAQPLVAAHVLVGHGQRILPESLVLVLGGYECPRSLEVFLRSVLSGRVRHALYVHAYGIAEVGPALLVGERSSSGEIWYSAAHPAITPLIRQGRLCLQVAGGDPVETGDEATGTKDHQIAIRCPEDRLSRQIRSVLEGWTTEDWRRRTGHVVNAATVHAQLRPATPAIEPAEIPFGAFVDITGMSWLDKPRWGSTTGEGSRVDSQRPEAK
jgi:hypothetical protein